MRRSGYRWLPKAQLDSRYLWVIFIFSVINTVLYSELAMLLYYKHKWILDTIVDLSFYSVFAVLISFVFALTKAWKADR
jgi:hypothetical protein